MRREKSRLICCKDTEPERWEKGEKGILGKKGRKAADGRSAAGRGFTGVLTFLGRKRGGKIPSDEKAQGGDG